MNLRRIKAGFVGFDEVNSPRELIEHRHRQARNALSERTIDLVHTAPVSPGGLTVAPA